MNQKDAERETIYQLVKLLIINLKEAGLITSEEEEGALRRAQERLKPIIGILD